MKRAIDIYTLHLFKENIVYIGIFVAFMLLLLFILPIQLQSYSNLSQKKRQLNAELAKLSAKRNTVLSFSISETDELVKTLNRLIPSKEDYFSLLTTIENLSALSGFSIQSYKANLSSTPNGQILVTINGEGTVESLFNFLRSYRSGGGRLITIKEIKLSPNVLSKITLQLAFYSKDVKVDNTDFTTVNKETVGLLQRINRNWSNEVVATAESTAKINYLPRSDPFQ